MIITCFSWIWIGISSLILGFAVYKLLNGIEKSTRLTPTMTVALGLSALAVYAEIFSLFYRVNVEANLLLLGIILLLTFLLRKDLCYTIAGWLRAAGKWRVLFILCLVPLLSLCASMQICSGDTFLYHEQAIRWIEDYGVVKGLGNLQTRYAFNSSFLCLQALFSLKFLTGGVSLHSVNGFICWIFLSYSICGMKVWKEKKPFLSDFARLALTIFVAYNAKEMTAPGTDIFPLCLVAFIVSEWFSLLEEQCAETAPFAELCIVAVFCVSLKLSAAMLVLLTVRPAYFLIREKKRKEIFAYLFAGVFVMLPFFIRNYYLSGWLVYPFESIDLFDVDWKIPVETVQTERWRTLVSTREVYSLPNYDPNCEFKVWIQRWFRIGMVGKKYIMLLDVVSGAGALAAGLRRGIRKKDWNFFHVSATLVIYLVYWFFSAPNVRYVRTVIYLLPLLLLGFVMAEIRRKWSGTFSKIFICLTAAVSIGFLVKDAKYERRILNWPYPYSVFFTGTAYELDGQTIYVPDIKNYISYEYFPSALLEETLDNIELRGETFADGFRTKDGVKYLF